MTISDYRKIIGFMKKIGLYIFLKKWYLKISGMEGRFRDALNALLREPLPSKQSFFRPSPERIKEILGGRKLVIFDVGAADNIEPNFTRYRHLLFVILVEPREDSALDRRESDSYMVQKLITSNDGWGVLHITRKQKLSSMLFPGAPFLKYYSPPALSGKFGKIDEIQFQTTTISSVLQGLGKDIHYLKIDTQGTELEVLKGLGAFRPLILKIEISFVPLYHDQVIFFELAQHLYRKGYILFNLEYAKRFFSKKIKRSSFSRETGIPIHGDAWFMPDWTRPEGREIIENRRPEYEALMAMHGLDHVYTSAIQDLESNT